MLVNCLFRCECNFGEKKARWFLSTCFHTAPWNFLQFNLHQCFLQKIIRRYAAFKGSKFKRPAFTFPIKQFKLNLFNNTVFQKAAKRDTCIWLSLYCVELSTGSKLQNILQLFFFFPNRRSFHPRRPRGRQSGRVERCNNGFQARAEKYKKIFFYLILCPQIGEQHLLRYFSVFVHDSAILFRFVHQRVKCTQSRNVQFDMNPVHFKMLSTRKLKHGNESGCFKTLSFQKFKLASITPSCFLKIVIINII